MVDQQDGVTTQVVVVCGERGAHWYEGGEEPGCADPAHEHLRIEVHRHRSTVVLPDGTELIAVSFDPGDPYGRDPGRTPDYGLYLDTRWQPPWDHELVDWPDFGVPAEADTAAVVAALRRLADRARAGERVEVGCVGGHGRTGTALACLAVLAGHPAADAVAWTRTNYCPKAVETPEQAAFVETLSPG